MYSKSEAHFTHVPGNAIPNSVFDLSHSCLTSFNVGELIPLTEPIEIIPRDNFQISIASKVYLNTLMFPIMDDLYMDIFTFYVPFTQIWDNYKRFEGENDTTPWTQETTYSVPQIESPDNGWDVGTLADYMGIPTGVEFKNDAEHDIFNSIGALQFRGYAKIVKDWFYDENVQTPPDFVKDDVTIVGSNGDDYVTDLIKGGKPFVVGKYHDLFTSSLPSPQKGPSVNLPLGNVTMDSVPVVPMPGVDNLEGRVLSDDVDFMRIATTSGSDFVPLGADPTKQYNLGGTGSASGFGQVSYNASSVTGYSNGVIPSNLMANGTSEFVTNATINDLRFAFQTQRLFELMARGGSNRYYEILANQWGVSVPALMIDRSELLSQKRFALKVHTSVQNSATDDSSPQANLAGYSITTNQQFHFKKGFFERGFIYILGCVRYHHSYSQGIPKAFKKKDRYDFYQNAFAHIGEQPIFNYEIYAQGTSDDYDVFGYNEYGVDLRFKKNMITGQMRPTYSESLDYMHLGDKFTELPTLSSDFIKEDKANVDRVIAVSSELSHQLRGDFYFDIKAIRPMPTFAIPGLIDHL